MHSSWYLRIRFLLACRSHLLKLNNVYFSTQSFLFLSFSPFESFRRDAPVPHLQPLPYSFCLFSLIPRSSSLVYCFIRMHAFAICTLPVPASLLPCIINKANRIQHGQVEQRYVPGRIYKSFAKAMTRLVCWSALRQKGEAEIGVVTPQAVWGDCL